MLKEEGLDKINLLIEHFVKALDQESVYKFSTCELDLIFRKGKVKMDSKTIPEIIEKLQGIIDEVSNESFNNGLKPNKRLGRISSSFYGYSIEVEDIELELWFGVEYNVWIEKGYPIVIWLLSDRKSIMKNLSGDENLISLGFENYQDKTQGEKVLILPIKAENDLNEKIIINKINSTIQVISNCM